MAYRKRSKSYRKKRHFKHFKRNHRQGDYCTFCNRRFFSLPFKCSRCEKLFCAEHRLPESHNCKGKTTIVDWAKSHEKFDKRPHANLTENKDFNKSQNIRKNFQEFHKPVNKIKFRLPTSRLTSTFSRIFLVGAILLAFEYVFLIEYFATTFYILEIIFIFFIIFKLFKRAERMAVRSDLHLFGLKILSGVMGLIGIFLFFWGIGTISFTILRVNEIQIAYAIAIFLIFVGVGLLILSAFLIFKFKRKSGLIVWHGA